MKRMISVFLLISFFVIPAYAQQEYAEDEKTGEYMDVGTREGDRVSFYQDSGAGGGMGQVVAQQGRLALVYDPDTGQYAYVDER